MNDPARSNRPTLAVATIGHHRHGKTTLTAAITQVLARRAPDGGRVWTVAQIDRRGGSPPVLVEHGRMGGSWAPRSRRLEAPSEGPHQTLTVAASMVRYATAQREFVHLDSPGRRPWLKNAARAQGVVDALIVVVSGPDGVQAQTREHLLMARALGLRQLVVFISKCDAVRDLEWLDLVEQDVRELLGRCGFDGDAARVIRGAALPVCAGESAWETSVADLIEALELELTPTLHTTEGTPLVYVNRVYGSRHGVEGVLVEGRVRRGTIRRGEALWLVGFGQERRVVVRDLESEGGKIDRAQAGEFAGVMLMAEGLTRWNVRTGQALVEPTTRAVAELGVELELIAPELGGRRSPLYDGHRMSLLFGSTVVSARMRVDGHIEPGEGGEARAVLDAPVYIEPGAPFVLRDGNQGPMAGRDAPVLWAGSSGSGRVVTVTR